MTEYVSSADQARVTYCVTTATAAGIQGRTLADSKTCSSIGFWVIVGILCFPDKEEVSQPRQWQAEVGKPGYFTSGRGTGGW
jgi:hypothetical protein